MKQENKNKRLALLLVSLLSAMTVLLYFQSSNDVLVKDKSIFKVEDLNVINQVILSASEDTVSLAFNGTRWLVNNKEAVDRDMIDVLFATLLQAEIKRPLDEKRNDSVAAVLRDKGVDVKLYQQNEIIKSFVAGGNFKKTEAYFLDIENNQVYVVNIPGYRVYVTGVFELAEQAWWDKYVFAFNWTNFKNLEVSYGKELLSTFTISMQEGIFGVEGIATDTTNLNNFLDALSLLTVDEYIVNDSIIKYNPIAQYDVNDIAGRKYTLQVLPLTTDGKTACLVNGTKAAWIDNRKLAPLLKNRDFFQKKP